MKKLFTLIIFSFSVFHVKGQETTIVNMLDFEYSPDTITVSEGDQVTWTNQGSVSHTVTSGANCTADSEFNSGDIDVANSYSRIFLEAGTFPYFCQYHCGSENMKGVVIVQGINGINNRRGYNEFTIFPNPVRNFASFESDKNVQGVEVYNAIGARCQTLSVENNGDRVKFGTANLEPGLYFVKVFYKNKETRLVKFFKE